MSDNLYMRFSKLTGEGLSGFDVHTDQEIRSAYIKARALYISAVGDKANNTLRELDAIYSVIGTEEGRKAYNAQHIEQILSHVTPVTETGGGLGERVAGRLRSARESTSGVMSKLKARITRPSPAKALGEPDVLPLVDIKNGAPLEPILDSNHLVLTTEEMAKLQPTPVLALNGSPTLAGKQAAASASLAAQRTEALTAQAKVAARRAEIVASAEAAALAARQAPNGTIRQRLSANTANVAEHATMPLIKRFATKDPYKILGITPYTSQTGAMAAFEAKLAALGNMRVTSPKAQHEWQRLHDAYEMVYEQLFERTKFTPPAIPVPERTSKIGAAFGRAREATAGMFGKMKGWMKWRPNSVATEQEVQETVKLLPSPIKLLPPPDPSTPLPEMQFAGGIASEAIAGDNPKGSFRGSKPSMFELPKPGKEQLPILHPTANGKLHPTASNGGSSSIKLITGPVYSSAELSGGRRYSYIGNAIEHSPLRGKLLLAGGVVAAAAIGYFGNRKQEKYPMPPMPHPRATNWVEATQQPAISGELLR